MWPAYGYLSPFSKGFLQKASLFCGHGWHAINTKCCLGSMPLEANCRCHPAQSHVHMRVGRCPHGMANCVTGRSDLIQRIKSRGSKYYTNHGQRRKKPHIPPPPLGKYTTKPHCCSRAPHPANSSAYTANHGLSRLLVVCTCPTAPPTDRAPAFPLLRCVAGPGAQGRRKVTNCPGQPNFAHTPHLSVLRGKVHCSSTADHSHIQYRCPRHGIDLYSDRAVPLPEAR